MFHGLFCLVLAACLLRLHQRGHGLLALTLLPLVAACCVYLARQPLCGAVLCWEQGRWQLERSGAVISVELRRGGVSLPWLVYLMWREPSAARWNGAYLFPDSASSDLLRRLRARLVLER